MILMKIMQNILRCFTIGEFRILVQLSGVRLLVFFRNQPFPKLHPTQAYVLRCLRV